MLISGNIPQNTNNFTFPELGRNLAGHGHNEDDDDEDDDAENDRNRGDAARGGIDDDDDDGELSTSGVGTVNSVTVAKPAKLSRTKMINDQITALRAENLRLMEDLYESHKMYHGVFKTALKGQTTNTEMVRALASQLMSVASRQDHNSQGYASDLTESPGIADEVDAANNNFLRPTVPTRQHSVRVGLDRRTPVRVAPFDGVSESMAAGSQPDTRLDEWLVQHGFNDHVRSTIHFEEFSYEDFIYAMEQDDLRRIGLR